MKYTIHGFDQSNANELGLTNDDLLILRWFIDFSNTKKMKTIIETDGVYYWVIYSQILQDLPILKISKERIKKKHFNNLCASGVLKHKHIKEGGSFSYYALGENYLSLVEKTEGGRSKMTEGLVQNDRPNNNILNNSINNNNIIIKENLKEKYFENDELNETFIEYLNLRKKLKAVNSDRAIKMLITELNKYDDDTKIKMIEQSIVNSWKSVYPLKNQNKKTETKEEWEHNLI